MAIYNTDMFTGLVKSIGTVIDCQPTPFGRQLTVELGKLEAVHAEVGQSIAVQGVCLTVSQVMAPGVVGFDVIPETLHRTTLGRLQPETRVNLEGALRAGEPLGGHFVQGHVDATTEVVGVKADAGDWRIDLAMPPECGELIVEKGSITIDGVSMTVAHADRESFGLAVIPTTLGATTLAGLRAGDRVNLETDILARYILKYVRGLELHPDAPGRAAVRV